MRQKLHKLKVLKKQITHTEANSLLGIEGFDVFKREIAANIVSITGRQRRDRAEIRHHRVEAAHTKRDLETRWPFELAAKATKTQIRDYLKPLSKNQRKKARRYFKRCHAVANGVQWRKHKPKRKLRGRKYTYTEYIHSPEWYDRRNRYYKAHGRKCGACGSSQKLHLHHMLYTDFDGTEPDAHLVPLCETHHDGYHALYGTRPNMIKTTMEYVDAQKLLHPPLIAPKLDYPQAPNRRTKLVLGSTTLV